MIRYLKGVLSIIAFAVVIGGVSFSYILAAPPSGGWAPGAQLEPDCAPGSSSDCTVRQAWEINTADGFVFNLADKVGIGTDTPSYMLDVSGDSRIATIIDSRPIAFVGGDISSFGGDKGFAWYTGNGTDVTGLMRFDENSDDPQIYNYFSNATDSLEYQLNSSGLGVLGGDFMASADVNDNGLYFSIFSEKPGVQLAGSGDGGAKNSYISVVDDGAGNPEVWLAYEDTSIYSDLRMNSTNAGLSSVSKDRVFSSYFSIDPLSQLASWSTNFNDLHAGSYFGSGENGGVPIALLQMNNLDTNIGYGFSAFTHNATFFRCNTNYPDITGPGCNDDRAVYVNDDSVESFVWTDDSIDNSNKNINGVRIDSNQVKMYFENQQGTPSSPGSDMSLVLNDNLSFLSGGSTLMSIQGLTGGMILGGASPEASAILELKSSERGFLMPRMNEASRDAISSPASGLLVYNTDSTAFNYFDGSVWQAIGGAATAYQFYQENPVAPTAPAALGDNAVAIGGGPQAVGNYSFALGYQNTGGDISALGSNSMAFGVTGTANSVGYGSLAIVVGDDNAGAAFANGDGSVAIGQSTIASGNNSFALGSGSLSSGSASFALNGGEASGSHSFAINGGNASGRESIAIGTTNAYSFGEITIGTGNTAYVPQSTNGEDADDRLFVVGDTSTLDALTILKNGKIGVAIDNFEAVASSAGSPCDSSLFQIGDGSSSAAIGCVNMADGSWASASDIRLKKNITDISYGLDTVLALAPKEYDFKRNGEHALGFIAQDVKDIVPEAVTGTDYLGISYTTFVPILTKAIQELDLKFVDVENGASLTLRSGLISWLKDTNNNIDEIVSRVVRTDRVETKELCIDDLCVNRTQLEAILQSVGQSSSGGSTLETSEEPSGETETDEGATTLSDDVPTEDLVPVGDTSSEEQTSEDIPGSPETESAPSDGV